MTPYPLCNPAAPEAKTGPAPLPLFKAVRGTSAGVPAASPRTSPPLFRASSQPLSAKPSLSKCPNSNPAITSHPITLQKATKKAIKSALTSWLPRKLKAYRDTHGDAAPTVILFFAGQGEAHDNQTLLAPLRRYDGAYDCSDWLEPQYKKDKCGPQPVGGKRANAWGLQDMIGNVWEWCYDFYGSYTGLPRKDPVGSSKAGDRVVCGGSWDSDAWNSRAAFRSGVAPSVRWGHLGFRLLRSDVR